MTVLTKPQVIAVIRRARPLVAASLAEQLPETLDLDDPQHLDLLFRLGLSRDQLFSDLGGEL
jgi:hypothetical protein